MLLFYFGLLAPSICYAACPYAGMPGMTSPISQSEQGSALERRSSLPSWVHGKNGVFLMNRIAPSESKLYIANADGTNERLLLGHNSVYEYHASFSPDSQFVAFSSERNGDGNSDLYMAKVDGSELRPIATTPAVEDAVAISPDNEYAAYASTRDVYTSNIWLTSLKTGETRNLTNQTGVTGEPQSPSGFFAPSWSPDGKWIVFSSDRNTGWTGHDNGTGWEHTQNLSIYTIGVDGSGFRKVYGKADWTCGQPKFSPDGKRIVFYQMSLQDTWDARSTSKVNDTVNQIASVDFKTGTDFVQHTSTTGCKISPQYVSENNIGYLVKGGAGEGLHYTGSNMTILGEIRWPSWSSDGKYVVYERRGWDTRALGKKLYSWDSEWDYRFMDVFPDLSQQDKLAYTSKQTGGDSPTYGNASIIKTDPSGTNSFEVFDSTSASSDPLIASLLNEGLAGAFQPSWSPDGKWIAFSLGYWFFERSFMPAWVFRAKSDGSKVEQLTFGSGNTGFPSLSPNGRDLVYRVYSEPDFGLRVLDLTTNATTVLTTERDNLPFYSPNGEWIVFTRNITDLSIGEFSNYEVCIIRPNGTDLRILTSSGANDGHAVWTRDGRIMWSSGMWGFQAEAAMYDYLFQPYAITMIMDVDGSNKRALTNSMWEDSMPMYLDNRVLQQGDQGGTHLTTV